MLLLCSGYFYGESEQQMVVYFYVKYYLFVLTLRERKLMSYEGSMPA